MKDKNLDNSYHDIKNFKYEEQCLEALKKYLFEQGYPKEAFHNSFDFDYDLLICNVIDDEPLICFEIKTKEGLRQHGYQYFRNHQSKNSNTLLYFAYLDEANDLKLIKMYSNMSTHKFYAILNSNYSFELPSYKEIVTEKAILKKANKTKLIKKKKDMFSLWCNGITFAILILFILELLGAFKWTTERIIIIGLISFIPILPLFAEIKIGDYTFKRKKQE